MYQSMNNIDKINMFCCKHCQYQDESNNGLKNHNKTFHDENAKYNCDVCGHQVTSKGNLARHKRAVHEGVKFPCGQCNHQATSKGHFAQHKRAIHEGIKYPCRQCNYHATTKGSLDVHKRAVHEGVNATINHHQKEILLDTKRAAHE